VTFQRKLLFGVTLLVLPALLIGAEAIRSNALEQRALKTLGERLGRNRTYAELETAMFDQTEVIWRHLTGMDPAARKEFELTGQVVRYWYDRWKDELGADSVELAGQVAAIQAQFATVGDSVFKLTDAGRREDAYRLALMELRTRLQPALTALNRQVYRRTRESSVQGAFQRVNEIVANEQRSLILILLVAVAAGLVAAWVIARGIARPVRELREAMALVGAGNLDHPIRTHSDDEIGDLARSFSTMTAQLRESRQQLVQSEKLASIGEMAAAVAHGLRNPLASLRASAQLVLRHPASPAAEEQLRAIVAEVDRLDRRISHLLSFSRPAPFRTAPEHLASLARNVLPAFTDRLRTQGVELDYRIPDDLPVLKADAMRIEQVLVELVANALDAMPEPGRLTLAAAKAAGPAGAPGVEVTVRDTGRGIPAETLALVGQPFFTTRQDGTGLGLATAKRFVEQHGGRLDLESQPGGGTTVRIWLPAA
jgi:signal transduction histidine kinase